MKKTATAIALTLLLIPTITRAEKATSGQHPEFSGSWVLNEAMSETARDKMRELMSKRRSGRGGFGGPPGGTGRGGGTPGRRGGGFGDPRDGRGGDRGGPMGAIDAGVDRIKISQSDEQFSITYSDERLRILFADGRKDERTGPMGDIETTAKWNKDSQLVVRSKSQRRKTTEIYKLDDAGRLLVDITLDTQMGKITFYRTYDPAPAEEPVEEKTATESG